MCLFSGGKSPQVPIRVPMDDMDKKVKGIVRDYETQTFENQYYEGIIQDICKVYNEKSSSPS